MKKKLSIVAILFVTVCAVLGGGYTYYNTDLAKKMRRGATEKQLYVFDASKDRVLNKMMKIRGYGSENYTYDRAEDEWSRKRVARFQAQDIEGKSVMDFGCNQGNILFMCKERGAEKITGIEHNSWCVEQANKRVENEGLPNANFVCSDMENLALYRTLPKADTVLLLAILDTSEDAFGNKAAIIGNISRMAKNALYYEGHKRPESHVQRMYEFMAYSDFTRFEYLGKDEQGRPLMRCGREIINEDQLPAGAVTTDSSQKDQLAAKEIYVYTDAKINPAFSDNCNLIQYVKRNGTKEQQEQRG
jgi:ubiquinone/menaquinone biosynthesis C-methylase UbiE